MWLNGSWFLLLLCGLPCCSSYWLVLLGICMCLLLPGFGHWVWFLIFFPFPILTTLHFAAPNSMWYFSATLFVMLSISCSVLRSWCMRQTSSIHRRVLTFSPVSVTIPRSCSFNSFDISSMSVAYSMTDSTPPCLMLSLILISLVCPCLVWIFAVRLLLSFFIIWRFFPVTPFLWRAYSMASRHALS